MDAQLERMSQQCNEFSCEKQELERELQRVQEQLTLWQQAAEPVASLREEVSLAVHNCDVNPHLGNCSILLPVPDLASLIWRP